MESGSSGIARCDGEREPPIDPDTKSHSCAPDISLDSNKGKTKMRRDAKEFRVKKSASTIDNKSTSMKLPECPLPSTANINVHHADSSPQHVPTIKQHSNVGASQPYFDMEKFHQDYTAGRTQFPPQVINFFMNNDMNQLSSKFFSAMQEGGYNPQAQYKKTKPKKNKSKQEPTSSEAKVEQKPKKVAVARPMSKQNSRQNSKDRIGSNRGSRSSSIHSTGQGERQTSHHRSATKSKKMSRHKHSSSQFKIDQRTNLNDQESDVLFANQPKPYHRDNSRSRFKKKKLASMEYYCNPMYKVEPKLENMPMINEEDFPTRPLNTHDKAAREYENYKLFSEVGDTHFT